MRVGSEKEDKTAVESKEDDPCDEIVKKLEASERKAEEYLQLSQRLQADFENFRKRTQRENDEFRTFATAELISDMLVVVDDLDRAIENAGEENEFVRGVEGIRQNLMKVMESKGLTEIPTDGGFDPTCHEAICVAEADVDGEIAEVFQKGYRIGKKVLRYSKVKVTKKKEESKMEGE